MNTELSSSSSDAGRTEEALIEVALGMGGNLGDVKESISHALARLATAGFRVNAMSSLFPTAAVGCPPGTPDFTNAAAIGLWAGTPEQLLIVCKTIEHDLGRPADHEPNSSRTIDIDILLVRGVSFNVPNLIIPHPRLVVRRFALEPLAEIAPDWMIGNVGITVKECLQKLLKASICPRVV